MDKYYTVGVKCSLCGLPIIVQLVDTRHPLSGTIDHVLPKALGGRDVAENRKPTHKICNNQRGVRDITAELRQELWTAALTAFEKHGVPVDKIYDRVRLLIYKKQTAARWAAEAQRKAAYEAAKYLRRKEAEAYQKSINKLSKKEQKWFEIIQRLESNFRRLERRLLHLGYVMEHGGEQDKQGGSEHSDKLRYKKFRKMARSGGLGPEACKLFNSIKKRRGWE